MAHPNDGEMPDPVVGETDEVSATMKIGVSGTSLVLKITKQARMLGLDRGDMVDVTIRRH